MTTVLITGAAGNLGGFLARHLLGSDLELRLMVHRTPLPEDLAVARAVRVVRADLGRPETLAEAVEGVDVIVHFAGVLFAPGPETFLPRTNTQWCKNLLEAARAAGVRRFVLVSFPHVEGPTTPEAPATDRSDRLPVSVHARTRLAEERLVMEAGQERAGVAEGGGAGEGGAFEPVILRVGMVYARGVLMIDAARWLAARHLLGVWRTPTWIHLISLVDFLRGAEAAVSKEGLRGVYNLGDESPTTLQIFLDRACQQWGLALPWRGPRWLFLLAAWLVECFARVFGTAAPITRDFIRIGMVDYVMDTARTREELLPELFHPSLDEGLGGL